MWKKFPINVPQEDGWYTCTVEIKNQQRYVRTLYWKRTIDSVYGGKWWDNVRQNVFDVYKVYNYNGERLLTSKECDWTFLVVAFQALPKPYMKGFEYISLEDRMREEKLKQRRDIK